MPAGLKALVGQPSEAPHLHVAQISMTVVELCPRLPARLSLTASLDVSACAVLLPVQAAGVAKTAPRHEWPVAVLQQVVGGLMREAPRQLIARELWAGSGSAAGWWRRQQLFAASTAVMSMVTTTSPAGLSYGVACLRHGWTDLQFTTHYDLH